MEADTALVHILSASCAGFVSSTLTNPIWFVKTRLQLDYAKDNRMTAMQCIRNIYSTSVSKAINKITRCWMLPSKEI